MPKNYKNKYRDLLKQIDESLKLLEEISWNKKLVSQTEREKLVDADLLLNQVYIAVYEAQNENYYEKGNN